MAQANVFRSSAADLIRQVPPAAMDALPVEQGRVVSRAKIMRLPAALIASFLFSQLFDYHALGLYTVTPDKILFIFIVGYFVYAALTDRLRSISFTGIEVCMLLFAILCTVSYCNANPDAGFEGLKWLTTLFNLIVYPFGVYLVAKRTRVDITKIVWLLRAIVCIGVYLALTASFEHFGVNALVFPKYIMDPNVGIQFGRARGPMVGSNPMGEWLVVVYLAICLLMPFARKVSRVLLYGLILLVTMGIYFTLTRGVWVSFAIVVILTAMSGGKFGTQSRVIILLVLVSFFVGVGSKFSFQGETLFSKRQNTIDYRMSNNETTYKMGMANFLTGVGYGKFMSNWAKYFGSKEKELTVDLTDGNHNTYLGLFADLGFPGVALYVTLFGFVLKDCIRIRKSVGLRSGFGRNLALSSIGLVAVTLWEAMSGDMRFDPTLNTVTFLFVGITASMKWWSTPVNEGIRRGAQCHAQFSTR
jgi:O-antigen ligase